MRGRKEIDTPDGRTVYAVRSAFLATSTLVINDKCTNYYRLHYNGYYL